MEGRINKEEKVSPEEKSHTTLSSNQTSRVFQHREAAEIEEKEKASNAREVENENRLGKSQRDIDDV